MYINRFPFYFVNVLIHLTFYFLFCIMPLKKDWRFSQKTTFFITGIVVVLFCISDILVFEKGAPLFSIRYVFAILSLLFVFCYTLLIIKKHYFQMLFVVTICFNLHINMTSLADIIYNIHSFEYIFAWFEEFNHLLIQFLILLVFVYPMWYLSAKLFSKVKNVGIDFLQWRLVLLLPLLLTSFSLIFESKIINKLHDSYAELVLLLFFMAASYIAYFSIFKLLIISDEKSKATQKAAVAQKQIDLQKANFAHLNSYIFQSARQRHDWRHHYLAIKGLVQSGDMAKAADYFTQYDKTHNLEDALPLCDNSVINAILTHYISMAKACGASVTTQINIPSVLAIDELELCACVGNVIENAAEACGRQSSENKYIDVKCSIVGKQLIFIVSNSFDGDICVANGNYDSSKTSGRAGIGIDSVKKIVDKNGGDIKIQHDNGKFKVSIILNLG